MKKIITLFCCIFISFGFSSAMANDACITIQDGTLTYSTGHYLHGTPMATGFDPYGSNYQAHLFSGSYANNYLGRDGFPPWEGDDVAYLASYPDAAFTWYWPHRDVNVAMKWNDAWLSNKDCGTQNGQAEYPDPGTPDGTLDRHYPTDSYIGSGAWLTNHMSGEYLNAKGKKCKWIYFTKIVAAPADAYVAGPYDADGNGTWYSSSHVEIGAQIWGAFATIQSVYNDPCDGYHGLEYLSQDHAGFGGW